MKTYSQGEKNILTPADLVRSITNKDMISLEILW